MLDVTVVQFDKIKAVYVEGRRLYYNDCAVVDQWLEDYKAQLKEYRLKHEITVETAPVEKSGCVSDRACPPPERWPYAPPEQT